MNEIALVRNVTAMIIEPETSDSMAPMQVESEAMTGTDILDQTSRKQRQILVIISSTVLTFTGCGLNFAYGVYQDLYETMDGPFAGASTASIDLIGTLAVSLMTLGAPFASAWTKTYGPRSVTLAGGLLSSVGMITASFSKSYWQFLCTQGLLLGLGTCLSYMPAVTVAPSWFDQRRGLAMGIILSGTGLGGVAWAPFLRYLNSSIGFRNALRVAGGLMFVLTAASALVLKWEPVTEAQRRVELRSGRRGLKIPKANWNIVRTRAFAAHAFAATLHAAAYCTPVYFFSTYARTLGYSTSAGASFIALSNACNCIGKIVLGFLADRYGRLNALVLCTLLSAAVTVTLWLPSSLLPPDSIRRGLFIAFTCLYGFTASAYVSLFPTALAEQFGVQNFASINGLLYMLRGMGTLVGTPIGGALVSHPQITTTGSVFGYEKAILLVASLLMGATFCVVWARVENGLQGGWKWKA